MKYQLKQIPSETQIKKVLRKIVFGSHLYCPECHSREVTPYGKRFRCKSCKCRFSLLSHTWLKDMKLDLQTFWLVLWCFVHKVGITQAIALCELSQKAIIHYFDLFRAHIPTPYEEDEILSGNIQMDEAYFGSFNKKFCLLMTKQTADKETGKKGKLIPRLLKRGKDPAKIDILNFCKDYIQPGSVLNTDGSPLYTNITDYWPFTTHNVDIHADFVFDHTSEIEGTFGNLKPFIKRMYYHISGDKLGSVVAEFCFRFNHPEIFKSPLSFLEISLRLVTTG